MTAAEVQREGYVISTDKARLDLHLIHDFLSLSSYWAHGRPLKVVKKSIEHSLCFGVYAGTQQVGFARNLCSPPAMPTSSTAATVVFRTC